MTKAQLAQAVVGFEFEKGHLELRIEVCHLGNRRDDEGARQRPRRGQAKVTGNRRARLFEGRLGLFERDENWFRVIDEHLALIGQSHPASGAFEQHRTALALERSELL